MTPMLSLADILPVELVVMLASARAMTASTTQPFAATGEYNARQDLGLSIVLSHSLCGSWHSNDEQG